MRIAIGLLSVLLAVGCGGKKKEDPGTGSGSGSGSAVTGSNTTGSAGSDTGSAGSGSAGSAGSAAAGSGAVGPNGQTMAHRGGMCPSTVFGSTTTAEVKDKAIVLTITAADKDAVEAIQKRAEVVIKEKGDGAPSADGAHDQKGSHGGGMGICPVHLSEGATATSAKIDNGVTITITPKDKLDVLKGEIDSRIKTAAEWVKTNVKEGDKGTGGGVGGGSGGDGMNHSGMGDGKGQERKGGGDGKGGGKGTGGGGGAGTGGGGGSGSAK